MGSTGQKQRLSHCVATSSDGAWRCRRVRSFALRARARRSVDEPIVFIYQRVSLARLFGLLVSSLRRRSIARRRKRSRIGCRGGERRSFISCRCRVECNWNFCFTFCFCDRREKRLLERANVDALSRGSHGSAG